MKLRNALLAATVLAAPVAAKAQAPAGPISGPYVSLGAGWNYLQDVDVKGVSVKGVGNPGSLGSKLRFDNGWVGVAAIGYGLGNGIRIEIEGDYRENQLRYDHYAAFPGEARGQEKKYGGMVNVLYSLPDTFLGIPLSPYVGVGAGYMVTQEYGFRVTGNAGVGPNGYAYYTNNNQGSFAYQGILGVSYDLGSVMPGLALTAEYRFLGTLGDQTYKAQYFAPNTARAASFKLGSDYNHSVLVGLRYAFNQAPPPPPPAPAPVAAPAPAPSRTYLVFFDWDRADLTARARQIVAEAAQASTRVQVTRIEVNGYTDLSGTAAYNQKLSVRRAQSVQAELIRDGVPANVISIHGYGESNPLVPTAQGVREPQNRRVEIILR